MSDWQERITHETAPAIRAEHELRYRAAVPMILDAGAWADLGCGNGVAAAAALGPDRPEHALLIDVDEATVAAAAAELDSATTTPLVADLTATEDLERIGAALAELDGPAVVTCFEVVEHLERFLPLIEWASSLAREGRATFVISVPNDAFWSIQNPHHVSSWSEGAFEELRRLLPIEQTLVRQVALTGSSLYGWERGEERRELSFSVGGAGAVATHFLAAFGPRHGELLGGELVVPTDMLGQRRWERQRENDLALMQKVADEHDAEIDALDEKIVEQRDELQKRTAWFEEWRVYIHELETELGRDLSGVSPQELPQTAVEEGAEPPA